MNRERKNSRRRTLAVLLIAATAAVLLTVCGMTGFLRKFRIEKQGYTAYVEKLLDLKLQDLVQSEEGEVKTSLWEKYAHICLTLKLDMQEEVRKRFQEAGRREMEPMQQLPGYGGHPIAKKMKQEKIIAWYAVFKDGTRAKTRSIDVYLTECDDGSFCLYLFG